MSVLTDPATYGILNSELTNCPPTAAVLGELATQWQLMMGSVQRAEQEIVANAIENMNRTRIGATGKRLRLKDGERLHPKSWSGSTSHAGCAREVAAWLGYVASMDEAWKMIQQIKKGALKATEAWTDGRCAADGLCVVLGCELAVALANVTEGSAKSTILKVTQVGPSRWFVA